MFLSSFHLMIRRANMLRYFKSVPKCLKQIPLQYITRNELEPLIQHYSTKDIIHDVCLCQYYALEDNYVNGAYSPLGFWIKQLQLYFRRTEITRTFLKEKGFILRE